jgi:hypothetical protein
MATAAAVLLLDLEEPPLASMMALVHSGSSPARLYVAAVVASRLKDESAAFVDKIVRELVANYRPEIGEALSVLVRAAPDSGTGLRFRLMQHCYDMLENEIDMTCWPLSHADYVISFPNVRQLRTLLEQGDEGAWAAYNKASALEEVYDGGQSRLFSEWKMAKLDIIRSYRPPQDHPDAPIYACAACAFGISEEIDYVYAVIMNPIHLGTVRTEGYHSYGAVMESPAARTMAYLGQFARLAGGAVAERAWRFLRAFDASPWHSSVRRTQLVAMGVLGDWKGLLSELTGGDLILHAAAVKVVVNFVPGPHSVDGDLLALGNWVAQRLEQQLALDERSTLEKVKSAVENKLGRYVVLEDNEKGRSPER